MAKPAATALSPPRKTVLYAEATMYAKAVLYLLGWAASTDTFTYLINQKNQKFVTFLTKNKMLLVVSFGIFHLFGVCRAKFRSLTNTLFDEVCNSRCQNR